MIHDRPVADRQRLRRRSDEGMKVTQPLRELGLLFEHVRPDAVRRRADGVRPLFPRNTLNAYWKSQYANRLPLTRDRRARGAGRRPTGSADLVSTFPTWAARSQTSIPRRRPSPREAPYMFSIDGMDDEISTRTGSRGCRSPPGRSYRSSANLRLPRPTLGFPLTSEPSPDNFFVTHPFGGLGLGW